MSSEINRVNERPSAEFTDTIVREINTDDHVAYAFGHVIIDVTRFGKSDNWVASFPRLRGTNLDGAPVLTKGYDSEKPQPRKAAFEHAFLALGRQLLTFADDCDSHTTETRKSVKTLTDENAVLQAQVSAFNIVMGRSTTPLTDAQRSLIDADTLAQVDNALAKVADAA